jgi:hypothetical protein
VKKSRGDQAQAQRRIQKKQRTGKPRKKRGKFKYFQGEAMEIILPSGTY